MQLWLSLLTGVATLLASFVHAHTLVAKEASRAQSVAGMHALHCIVLQQADLQHTCMHALHCMLQIIFSITIAFASASWEAIKSMPRGQCIELTADCPPDQLHQLKDVRHATLCNSCA